MTIILVNTYDIDSSLLKGQRNIPKLGNQNFTDLNEGRDQESQFGIDVTLHGFYDVGHGSWRRKVLVTTKTCW